MGIPLLEVNLWKLFKKACEVRSVTISRCTALTIQQVYRHIQTFLVLEAKVSLVYRGPAKSIPVYENGGARLLHPRARQWRGRYLVWPALEPSANDAIV